MKRNLCQRKALKTVLLIAVTSIISSKVLAMDALIAHPEHETITSIGALNTALVQKEHDDLCDLGKTSFYNSKPDYQLAFQSYLKADDMGSYFQSTPEAARMLGLFYCFGYGVLKSETISKSYWGNASIFQRDYISTIMYASLTLNDSTKKPEDAFLYYHLAKELDPIKTKDYLSNLSKIVIHRMEKHSFKPLEVIINGAQLGHEVVLQDADTSLYRSIDILFNCARLGCEVAIQFLHKQRASLDNRAHKGKHTNIKEFLTFLRILTKEGNEAAKELAKSLLRSRNTFEVHPYWDMTALAHQLFMIPVMVSNVVENPKEKKEKKEVKETRKPRHRHKERPKAKKRVLLSSSPERTSLPLLPSSNLAPVIETTVKEAEEKQPNRFLGKVSEKTSAVKKRLEEKWKKREKKDVSSHIDTPQPLDTLSNLDLENNVNYEEIIDNIVKMKDLEKSAKKEQIKKQREEKRQEQKNDKLDEIVKEKAEKSKKKRLFGKVFEKNKDAPSLATPINEENQIVLSLSNPQKLENKHHKSFIQSILQAPRLMIDSTLPLTFNKRQ